MHFRRCRVPDRASSSLALVRRYWPMLFLLAAIWGASYLFIKVAVEDIEPAPMMAARTLVAGAVLAAYLLLALGREQTIRELRESWRPALVLGAVNAAIPFWLVAWGEKHVDSSVAGIAQSTVPIFTFLVAARFVPGEHVGPLRVLGIALGLLGVAVLAGLDPRGGWWAVAGTLAVVLSSLSYAFGGVYGQLRVRTVSGPVLATGSMLAGGLILLPLAFFQLPERTPSAEAVGGLFALTLLGTAFGQLLLFRMLRLYGSRQLSLVTYLIPGFALGYGAVVLSEPITAAALVGLALILVGVALGSGQRLLGLGRRGEPVTP
jgi:drug/metabolite transporter (DMT)-like permease